MAETKPNLQAKRRGDTLTLLLRSWKESADETNRYRVEDPHSGDSWMFDDWQTAMRFLQMKMTDFKENEQ